jgi:hypothetical protein
VSRPALEVADILRHHGPAWRKANAGHVSLGQLKVMSAIESCRTAALGGHVARCEDCAHTLIAYNSCRNRHCPKCQGAAAREWLATEAFGRRPTAHAAPPACGRHPKPFTRADTRHRFADIAAMAEEESWAMMNLLLLATMRAAACAPIASH